MYLKMTLRSDQGSMQASMLEVFWYSSKPAASMRKIVPGDALDHVDLKPRPRPRCAHRRNHMSNYMITVFFVGSKSANALLTDTVLRAHT